MNDDTTAVMHKVTIQKTDDTSVTLELGAGKTFYLVGPNGSGKSALISMLVGQLSGVPFKRIAAHRQTWLPGDAPNFAPSQREQLQMQQYSWNANPRSRYAEQDPSTPIGLAIAALIATENEWHRSVVSTCMSSDSSIADYMAKNPSPLTSVNEVLGQGGLSVRVEIAPGDLLHGRYGKEPSFGVSRLSDGERSAILLAADVISAVPGTVFLIDEPERHLHRAIMASLLRALFRKRADCAFVIGTHEISLPSEDAQATSIVLRRTEWVADEPQAFDLEILEPRADLPTGLKTAILGSKKRILFVEGNDTTSLDSRLYAVMFPNVSVVAKETCREVIQAVDGLRSAHDLIWLEAFGLVDRDDRGEENVGKLEARGIFALPVCSVEALYYGSAARKAVAHQQAEILGKDADDLLEAGEKAGLAALTPEVASNLCALRAERRSHEEILKEFPEREAIKARTTSPVTFDVQSVFDEEMVKFDELLKRRALDELMSCYQLRKSECYAKIAAELKFRNSSLYEDAVVSLAQRDDGFLAKLRATVKPLGDALGVSTTASGAS